MTILSSISFLCDAIFQCYFIPRPKLTEHTLPCQSGTICLITGGYVGIGKELARILYQAGGTVYIAGRSRTKFEAAADDIKQSALKSEGQLEFLELDLADLRSVKNSAEEFQRRERRLDVLVNNAGVMNPPVGSITKDGYELQLGTNVLGPWLFTYLLTPTIQRTAADPHGIAGATRVLWASSLAHIGCPRGGVGFDASGEVKVHHDRYTDYAQSKAANILLAREYQARYGTVMSTSAEKRRIVSVPFHPGALKTELLRHQTWYEDVFAALFCRPAVYGAYTELWAGWSEDVGKKENEGKYVVPWSRFGPVKETVEPSMVGPRLWEWCERAARDFLV